MRISPPRYKYSSSGRQIAFLQELLQRIKAMPGVLGAAAADTIPFGLETQNIGFRSGGTEATTSYRCVTPEYFRTMGIPLLKGRLFDERDRAPDGGWSSERGIGGAPGVVIVNEVMARRYWPDGNPIGKFMNFSNAGGRPARLIVGVVGAALHKGLDQEAGPEAYVPYYQRPSMTMFLAVRARDDARSAAAGVLAQIRALDRDQPVEEVRTMEQLMGDSVAPRRFLMLLLSLFGSVSLALAAVGIYGVAAYAAAGRAHEIGIRMALGAQPGDALRLVVTQGLWMLLAGESLGLAGAVALNRLLAGMVFGITTNDSMTYAAVCLVWAAVGCFAGYLPARRAARIDPLQALRCE
jgi:putative ABC transport system permease protein